MSRDRLPPPQPEACLITSRASRYKGGTIIAEEVVSEGDVEGRGGHGHSVLTRVRRGAVKRAYVIGLGAAT